MDQHHDDFFENAQKATDKGRFLKLPRYQRDNNSNFDGFYCYSTKIAHFDLPTKANIKFAKWSPINNTHYNYIRRLLEDHYGFRSALQK